MKMTTDIQTGLRTGVFPIETTPEFTIEHAYTAVRYGHNTLRLDRHVQKGGSILYGMRYAFREPSNVTNSLDHAISALTSRGTYDSGLPSINVPMLVTHEIELDNSIAAARHLIGMLTRHDSQLAEEAETIGTKLVAKKAEEVLAGAYNKATETGINIVDYTNERGDIWLIVNPSATGRSVNVLDEFNEGQEIKVAKLRGLIPFELNGKVFAHPVVEGKRRKIGKVVTSDYKPHSYLFV